MATSTEIFLSPYTQQQLVCLVNQSLYTRGGDLKRNGSLVKINTFKAVCFLRISFDLNMTAAIQIVTKKPKTLQKGKENKLKGLFKINT